MTARIRQADVARMAGVSQTTVSMVLNGTGVAQRRVRDEVHDRVIRAIEVTGYAANPMAQRLAGGHTHTIGVYTYESVFPVAGSDFYYPFLEGVESEAQHAGVDLLMFTSMHTETERRLVSVNGVARLRVADGCVLLGRRSHPPDLAELLRHEFPFAFVGRREAPDGQVPFAGADYATATQEIVERLISLGHRRIVLINEFAGHESAEDRARGYRWAMTDAGLQPVSFNEPHASPGELLDSLLEARVSAVAVSSDLAEPLRAAALDRGMSIPGHLSITRLGDPERLESEEIDWTGFRIPRREMGANALRIVLRQLDPGNAPAELQSTTPCTVVPGTTAGPYHPATLHAGQ